LKIQKSLTLLTILFLVFPVFIHSQTAAELETIIDTESVTCAQAAWIVCNSAGDKADMEAAFNQAVENGWLKTAAADDPITLGKLSFLMMQAFEIKGGMMYSLAAGPRYAYRSMVSKSYIEGSSDPAMKVSGERFLLILGKVLDDKGEDQ